MNYILYCGYIRKIFLTICEKYHRRISTTFHTLYIAASHKNVSNEFVFHGRIINWLYEEGGKPAPTRSPEFYLTSQHLINYCLLTRWIVGHPNSSKTITTTCCMTFNKFEALWIIFTDKYHQQTDTIQRTLFIKLYWSTLDCSSRRSFSGNFDDR